MSRIRAWGAGSQPADAKLIMPEGPPGRTARDVYVYFDNDAKVRAPQDARSLAAKLDLLRTSGPLPHAAGG